MAREIVLLVNPVCGGTRGLRLVAPVTERLRRGGARVRVVYGRSPDESGAAASRAVAERPHALVTLGGDGLVNAAIQAVAGTEVDLGIVPAGAGNDVARALGVPTGDPLAAADVVLDGAVRTVDAGRCAGRWFGGVASAGFDSLVTERANRMTYPRGQARYVVALLAELRMLRPLPFTVGLDGRHWDTEAVMVAVGNGGSYGGGMRICPDADPADGLLDVTVVGPVSRPELLRFFPTVYRGTHPGHPAVTTARARVVSVAARGVTAYADGEPFGPLPVTCEAVRGALRVLAPPRSRTNERDDAAEFGDVPA